MNHDVIKTHVPTSTIARLLGVNDATVRRSLCVNGHYMGLKPVKLPNNRLLWSQEAALRLINGSVEE